MATPFDWFVHHYLAQLMGALVDPQKRVSLLYLLAAAAVALAWGAWVSRGSSAGGRLGHGLRLLFSPAFWISASARADYKLLLVNQAIMMLIAPRLLSKMAVATVLFYAFHDMFGASPAALRDLPVWFAPVSLTVFLFLLDDLSRYLLHRALHRVPLLWAFHKTHHSAETLTPFTVYRTHPVEGVLFALRGTLVQAVSISLFVFLFGQGIDLVSIYGVNLLLFVFNAAGANLRHSHVPIRYGARLEHVFISPAQHQIHHSLDPRHHGRNFGVALALWDWAGGTLCVAAETGPLRFGLAHQPPAGTHRLFTLYAAPFREAYALCARAVRSRQERLRMVSNGPVDGSRSAKGLRLAAPLAAAVMILAAPGQPARAAELNVYSHRQPFLIEPFLQAFEKQSGVKVNVVYSATGLVQRLLAEGTRSPADVVLTVDIGRLYAYADKDLLAPVSSPVLEANIPAHLRDGRNRWFAFSKRARVLATARERVAPGEIKTLEDLADPKWKGRVCTRPGSHVYNRALMASMVAAHGEQAAEKWARGLVSNLARRPQGNDRSQVKAIHEGVCDVAIINSYYYGKLKTSDVAEQRSWAESVRIVFTNQEGRGNHVNISGGGVARHSKNKALAVKLLEFLTEDTAQKLYSEINTEYPVNPRVEPSGEIRSWGSFKEDKLPISRIAELAPAAQRIIDRVGW